MFCCDTPRLAYFDRPQTCRACGDPFVFTAAQQARWYEQFKLPPHAEPIDCGRCRATKRRKARANTELASRLHQLDPRDASQLAEIARLYLETGSSRKASEYLRRAKNVTADPHQAAQLLDRLASIEHVAEQSRSSAPTSS